MCAGPNWKREKVPDHKFDFIDTREFTDNGFGMRMKYLFLYAIVLKSFLVYVSDIFSAITMLTTDSWSNDIFNSCPPELKDGCVAIDFRIGKWIFFGCIIFGFLLLAYEARKAKKIIQSRDISYAFTNVMANNYYSLRSYDHFCFFDHISNSTKKKDDFAFFVFFTFKGWKRLLLADGPRQAINAITLYSFYLSKSDKGDWDDFSKYFDGRTFTANALTCTIVFTVVVFAGSLLLLIAAGICYIPLLCYIRGNLKEYCCHKVDKRIREILNRRNKQRQQRAMALAKKEAEGDFSHLKGKKGGMEGGNLPMPTLPNVELDDDELDDGASLRTRGPPPSTFTAGDYYSDQKPVGGYNNQEYNDYPPMPGYGQQQYGYYGQQQQYGDPQQQYHDPQHMYNDPAMAAVYGEREPYFQDNYGSVTTLPGQPGAQDPRQAYGQHAHTQSSDWSKNDLSPPSTGLAYDSQDYPSPTSGGPPVRTTSQPMRYSGGHGDAHNQASYGGQSYGAQQGGRGGYEGNGQGYAV